jgi:hypothetical protein
MKKALTNLAVLAVTVVIILVLGELTLRVVHYYKWKRPLFFAAQGVAQPLYPDAKLGWRATENYNSRELARDAAGKTYQVCGSSDGNGFRFFGDPPSEKIKILVIGDSYTQAIEVSNARAYYGVMAAHLPKAEFFVYGAGGYGTLQEYLIIDEWIERIKPQVLLLQLCTNDFINNSYALEHASWGNNNLMRRPYLDDCGKIFYKNPARLNVIPDNLLENSRLIFYGYLKFNKLLAYLNRKNTIYRQIKTDVVTQREYARACRTTGRILMMITERTPGVERLAFCSDKAQPFYDEMKQLAAARGFHFIDGVPQAIREAEKRGRVTRAADRAHWNELGHQLAAAKIIAYFNEQQVLDKALPAGGGNPTAGAGRRPRRGMAQPNLN